MSGETRSAWDRVTLSYPAMLGPFVTAWLDHWRQGGVEVPDGISVDYFADGFRLSSERRGVVASVTFSHRGALAFGEEHIPMLMALDDAMASRLREPPQFVFPALAVLE